jgi:hypothetical protein
MKLGYGLALFDTGWSSVIVCHERENETQILYSLAG